MAGHPSVVSRLERLAPDQRAAATAPPGPILCVAPAGSGKTTTLVARIAWLVDGGAAPGTIAAITFNKRAADELRGRLEDALAHWASSRVPSGSGPFTRSGWRSCDRPDGPSSRSSTG